MLQASCWDTQYTEATCCPLSHGPEGNPTCWDGLHFTYHRCCPPKTILSSTCVPQSSFVAAVAATVLVSSGLLLVRPSFCKEKQLKEGGNRLNHDFSVDNAKFLTSIFFILVHICGGSPADKPASAVIAAIRFHLPLSCMISGALSSKVLTEDRRVRMIAFLVWPLVVFVLLLLPALDLFGQVVLSSPGIRGHDFAATYADVWKALAMMDRWDTGWYLRALICWKLALPLTAVLTELQQVILAFLVGMLGAYSHHREWPVQITTLWPFFSFGQLFLRDFISWISCRSMMPESLRLVLGWTLLTAWICSYVIFEPHIDSILRTVEPRRQEFAGFRDVIASECEADIYLLWSKYVMCLFLRGIMALIFLTLCVPRAKNVDELLWCAFHVSISASPAIDFCTQPTVWAFGLAIVMGQPLGANAHTFPGFATSRMRTCRHLVFNRGTFFVFTFFNTLPELLLLGYGASLVRSTWTCEERLGSKELDDDGNETCGNTNRGNQVRGSLCRQIRRPISTKPRRIGKEPSSCLASWPYLHSVCIW